MNAMTSDEITLKTVNLARLRHDPNKAKGLVATPEALRLLACVQFVSRNVERFRQAGQCPRAGRVPSLVVLFVANHERQTQSFKPKDSFAALANFA